MFSTNLHWGQLRVKKLEWSKWISLHYERSPFLRQ
jgi:hypothetical protein